MARLPEPGQDNGVWGDILNDYLQQALKPDGGIKDNVVTASSLAPNSVTNDALASNAVNASIIEDGSITEQLLASDVQVKLNATGSAVNAIDILDSTSTGRSVLTAADAGAARTAIGAGTSNLVLGTVAGTAKAGDYAPTRTDVGLGNVDNTSDATKNSATATLTNKTISGADNTLTNISQSSVVNLVSDLSGKAAVSHSHVATQISDSTATGRLVLTAVDASAARTAIGAGTSNLVLGTTAGTAKAGDYAPTKTDVGLGNVDNTSDATKNSASVTLTNKTLTDPRINTIKDGNGNNAMVIDAAASAVNHVRISNSPASYGPAVRADGPGADVSLSLYSKGVGSINLYSGNDNVLFQAYEDSPNAVNFVYSKSRATGNGAEIGSWGDDANIDLDLWAKGNGVVKANGSEVATIAGTSRRVCVTAQGGADSEDGTDTWAKIVTFSSGTSEYSECQLILSVAGGNSGNHDTAIVSVYFRTNGTGTNPDAGVYIIAKGGSGFLIGSDSFKVISGGWSTDMELWIKKTGPYGQFSFYETSKQINGGTLTYTVNPGWQSAVPSGIVNNVVSQGVYSGLPMTIRGESVITTANTQTLTNKTISGSGNTLTNIPVGAIATTGTADSTTYLRGDGSWQSVSASSGGGGSLSGFALGLPGERSYSRSIEIGSARAANSAPAGSKMNVLAEVWDNPGILKRIWVAFGGAWGPSDFGIRGGTIRIYIDDATDPAVDMTMGDFFFVPNNEDVYTNARVGRTVRSSGQASMYRYVHMPYKKYLRVEIENTTNTNQIFYGAADYSTVANFSDIGSQQLAYKIAINREATQDVRTPLTICDFAGAGQIESIMASFVGDDGDAAILEGNVEIFVDGESMPTWSSSGMEDVFNGGWYTVPVGGYPAGRPGLTSEDGERHTLYRFFVDDPIFFTTHLKVVIWAGQYEQASLTSSEVEMTGAVGYWLNTETTPGYSAVDMIASPLLDDQFNYSAGSLNPAVWAQDVSRTQLQATGTSISVPYGNLNPDQDTRAVRNDLGLSSNYWIETRVRITDAAHADQEAHIVLRGSSPDAYYGSAIHIQLRRFQDNNWAVAARDDFDTPGFTNIGSGRNLTNAWVRLAAKVEGNEVTAYYSLNDTPSQWVAFAKWTTAKNGPSVGIGTWTAGAEFDYLVVRPLKSVTS